MNFNGIPTVIDSVMNAVSASEAQDLESVLAADTAARGAALRLIAEERRSSRGL